MGILQVLLLFFQLQHLHASSNPSSPLISDPASNKDQLVHEGNMAKQETEREEKVVSNVNKHGVGGGGGGHGSHAAAAHGGSYGHGGIHGRGVGGGDSNVLPKYGGVVAGAGAGGAYDRNNHNYGKHSGVSSCCVHPYYLLLTTNLLFIWQILL